jgi:serine/threonine protein kinase
MIGEYEIIARIGVGGMGEVYEGRQPLIGKRVAVKVLLPSLSREKEVVDRFLAEARAVNEIRHRGIVDIFSFGQLSDGTHYFVMEYLEGLAFDKLLKQRGPLPIAEALGYVEEVLDALDAAHAAGIVHRDIKPSNVFLVKAGRGRSYVKLLDFGIAKLGGLANSPEAAPHTRASMILGTPDYISPEQARGQPISPATDLYALGVVMFELLTGKRPFRGENTLQTMWMHVEDAPPVPSSLRADLPASLDELVLWTLQKNPAQRPASAEELRSHLDALRASLLPGVASMSPTPTGNVPSIPAVATPSGRQALLSGTPPPRANTRSLSGARSKAVPVEAVSAATPESDGTVTNRLTGPAAPPAGAPPTASVRHRDVAAGAVIPEPELDPDEAEDAPKRSVPLIIGAVSVGAIALGAVVLLWGNTAPAPAPARDATAPASLVDHRADVEPVLTPKATAAAGAAPAPTATADAGPSTNPPTPTPVAEADAGLPPKEAPARPKPAAPGLTQAQLEARLARVKAKIATNEARMDEPDVMLRGQLAKVEQAVREAADEASRKAALAKVAELEASVSAAP